MAEFSGWDTQRSYLCYQAPVCLLHLLPARKKGEFLVCAVHVSVLLVHVSVGIPVMMMEHLPQVPDLWVRNGCSYIEKCLCSKLTVLITGSRSASPHPEAEDRGSSSSNVM